MAGTAKAYDVARMQQGPGDLWIIGGGVADSATPQLTIATDGTPDASAHPASIHLGATDGAIAVAVAAKVDDISADQFDGPLARYVQSIELSLEAELKQLDPTIMQSCAPFATFATASGYAQLTFGGVSGMGSGLCVACIAPRLGASGKYDVVVLFKAHGVMGPSFSHGRAKTAVYKAQFKALTDPTRTAGRQMGVFYETK